MRGGFLGVDLFFVLSGFLITCLLLGEIAGTGGMRSERFWARRARRLLPRSRDAPRRRARHRAAGRRHALDQIRGDALATIGYVANWHAIFAGRSYFDALRERRPRSSTRGASRSKSSSTSSGRSSSPRRRVAPVDAGRAARVLDDRHRRRRSSRRSSCRRLYDPQNTARAYYGTDTRAAALFVGIAVAAVVSLSGRVRRDRRTGCHRNRRHSALLAHIAWRGPILGGDGPASTTEGFSPSRSPARAVIVAVVPTPAAARSLGCSRSRRSRWFGLISYGLYLWHWPVDVFLDAHRVGLPGWALFAVQSAVAVAISIASYHLVELPIRDGAFSRPHLGRLTPAAAAVAVGVVLVSTTGAIRPAIEPAAGYGHCGRGPRGR